MNINIGQHTLNCTLDTGSQVSIVPLWFFEKLYGVKLQTKPDWLIVKSASGDTMKYIGYFMTDIRISGIIIRNKGFLVTNNDTLKIIGMNILRELRFIGKQTTLGTGDKTVKVKALEINKRLINEDIHIDSNTRKLLENLLNKYEDIFAVSGINSPSSAGSHRIRTINDIPVCQPYRRIPPTEVKAVKDHINNLIREGVIEESSSMYSSPIVLVKKKSGELRMCVDYRKLNAKVVRDQYPLPRVDDSLDAVAGSIWFTTLDLKSAYSQIPVIPEDQNKTAFSTPFGLYNFKRMPFGLANAPATFQRIMANLFRRELMQGVICYLDDILIYSHTIEEHLKLIEIVLERLQSVNLRLNSEKCSWFHKSVSFLGHIISEDGIATDDDKLKVVRDWEKPQTIKQLRSFIGFASYYGKFIPKFTSLCRPLHELIIEKNNERGTVIGRRSSTKIELVWSIEALEAFENLKIKLCSTPILGYPDYHRKFRLDIDASDYGLGAVLSQECKGKMKVISYASKTVPKSWRKPDYSSKRLEFNALVWAVTKKFNHYLIGTECDVYTDNIALSYINSTHKLSAYEQRGVSKLAPFKLNYIYRKGRENVNADALSRLNNVEVNSKGLVVIDKVSNTDLGTDLIPMFSREEIISKQKEDDELCAIREKVEKGNTKFEIIDGVLFANRWGNEACRRIMIPRSLIFQILEGIHDGCGHQGIERVIHRVNLEMNWKGKYKNIRDYIRGCTVCNKSKGVGDGPVKMGRLSASRPLEMISIDFITVDKSSDGRDSILVITDIFTKFTKAVATRNQSALTVAKVILNEWIYNFGIPERIHSDQGRNFVSSLIKELCMLLCINQSKTTSYHPAGNGQTERMNRTLLSLLRSLSEEKKSKWPLYLNELIHAYNILEHSSTGYSPFFLMFGREERIPIQQKILGNINRCKDDWIIGMGKRIIETKYKVKIALEKAWKKRSDGINGKVVDTRLYYGDKVRIKRRELGRKKLMNIWSDNIWSVVRRMGTNETYEIETGDGKSKVLHRSNMKKMEVNIERM